MLFTLDIAALPDGYGEAVLPIADAKAHLRVLEDDEDDLIEALRDAAVLMVESYTGLILQPREGDDALVWRAECLPGGTVPRLIGARPIRDIVSVTYLDADGSEQSIDVAGLRVVDQGSIAPVPGTMWPSGVAGGVTVTFSAGLDTPPPQLVSAAKMFLATLYMERESVVTGGTSGELTPGFLMLCRPFRRVRV